MKISKKPTKNAKKYQKALKGRYKSTMSFTHRYLPIVKKTTQYDNAISPTHNARATVVPSNRPCPRFPFVKNRYGFSAERKNVANHHALIH